MWLDLLFQGCMDAVQSEQVSRTIRILCTALISFVFLIAISSLFLLVFVIEGQGLFRRGIFHRTGYSPHRTATVHYYL